MAREKSMQDTFKDVPMETPKESKKEKNPNSQFITQAHRDLIGKKLIVNEVHKTIETYDDVNGALKVKSKLQTLGATKADGSATIRIFEVTEKNLEELVVLLKNYENGYIKE